MKPAVRASLLWGVIGALLFGVLSLAYQLLTEARIAFVVILLVMLGVGVVTAVLSYLVDTRL